MFRHALLRLVVSSLPLLALLASPLAVHATDIQPRRLSGTVVDVMGGIISGATVTLHTAAGARVTHSAADGSFVFENVASGPVTLTVALDLFAPRTIDVTDPDRPVRVVMDPLGITEAVRVQADVVERRIATATRTSTPVRDVPQAISTVNRDLIADQTMSSMADVVNYVAGVGMAQGEGHRDAPIFRGNTSTSDFFVDGLRDDTQYLRDLYNVERVEVLKGPNGMMFGRGGAGGVINRVTRRADGSSAREFALQAGSWNQRRVSADVGQALTGALSARVAGVYENSETYRAGAGIERIGLNPSVALDLGRNTRLTASYEFFRDERTVDRGVPSYQGRPLDVDPATFFGNPDANNSGATVNALGAVVEHQVAGRLIVRNSLRYADYDKFYENVVPGAVDASGASVPLTAYTNATGRQNVFNQTDLILSVTTRGLDHTLVIGGELGRQATDNRRRTGFFADISPTTRSLVVPIDNPTTSLRPVYEALPTDADNHGIATVAAVYLQDQIVISPRLHAIAGLRYDRFDVDFLDRRSETALSSSDALLSPRVGVIFKPVLPVSLYASYTRTSVPRAGEQLASLSVTTQSLEPESFTNYEVGAKWELTPMVIATAAVYRLDRGNVVVPDAIDPRVSHLVDAQRTTGAEFEISGRVLERWTMQGGYAYQDGKITQSLSATVQAGAQLGQVPRHSFSLWNRYDATARLGLGLGVISVGDRFVATDNAVVLPSFTRVDGAVFFQITPQLRGQVNVENLLDTRYYWAAHSNNNIAPGSPRAVRFAVTTRF